MIIKNLIKKKFFDLIKNILKKLNLKVLRLNAYNNLIKNQSNDFDIKFIKTIESKNIEDVLKYFDKSQSQIRQDLFVASELNFKKDGFFVEFGAADGKYLSNTYFLEKELGWKGIIAEPSKSFHKKLFVNRKCSISKDCVWKYSNSLLSFYEAGTPELSLLKEYHAQDSYDRNYIGNYNVKSISLSDLLLEYNAPKKIDYISIDTEGSEFDILSNFNFQNYDIKIITCEHLFHLNRKLINELLINNGFIQKYKDLSAHEDWYINPSFY